jgi:hypothetical protein
MRKTSPTDMAAQHRAQVFRPHRRCGGDGEQVVDADDDKPTRAKHKKPVAEWESVNSAKALWTARTEFSG